MACLCNDPAATKKKKKKRNPFKHRCYCVWAFGRIQAFPPLEPASYKGASVSPGPQAQHGAHGYPWVLWRQSFVAGHQRKHTDNRWPPLSSTTPRGFCWLGVTQPTERQRDLGLSQMVSHVWSGLNKQHIAVFLIWKTYKTYFFPVSECTFF